MNGSLAADQLISVIVLSFGVMQPLITAYSYTDDLAQLGTIVGEVADILEQEDLHRPGTAASLPKDNSIQLKDVRFAYGEKRSAPRGQPAH